MTYSREGIRKAIEVWGRADARIPQLLCAGDVLPKDNPHSTDRIHILDLQAIVDTYQKIGWSNETIVQQIYAWSCRNYATLEYRGTWRDAETTGLYKHYYLISGQLWSEITRERGHGSIGKRANWIATRMIGWDDLATATIYAWQREDDANVTWVTDMYGPNGSEGKGI